MPGGEYETENFGSFVWHRAGAVGECRRGAGQDRQGRRSHRQFRPLFRPRRRRLDARRPDGDRGFRACGQRLEDRSGLGRPPEQARHRPTIARQWIDVEKVDIFMDVLNSGVALAVNNLVKEKNAIMINTGAATSDLTNAQCSPNTIHWVYDTYMLANSTGQALVKAGGDTWYFLTADYAFGHALERDTTAVVVKSGGKVIGSVKHPLNTADFSSFLLQAQASKAKIVGMANAGGDTTNTIKQAAEFGIVAGGQKLAG